MSHAASPARWRVVTDHYGYILFKRANKHHNGFESEQAAQSFLCKFLVRLLWELSRDGGISAVDGNRVLDVWQARRAYLVNSDSDDRTLAEIRPEFHNNYAVLCEAMRLFDTAHPSTWSITRDPALDVADSLSQVVISSSH